ncbi:unnamed protein product [Rotaria sp. Silwood1]|nr:unnamed protein product [Rotaria sp. Silwood1]CAF0750159.1 unnamed protein product [Rotaria sp. Silwood1]CAF3329672.1 unnamed protein product [Rotaria sp. Silwood1]
MADNRFPTRTFTNSNSIRNNTNTNSFRFDNNPNEHNHSQTYIPRTSEDWDVEIDEKKTNNTKQWSQSFDPKNNHSSRSSQDFQRPLNKFNRNNNINLGQRVSYDYLINSNDVPRLIGKGGETIKQIQRENDVQIKVSNDRQNQWVDLIISGSNDQVIKNAFNRIKNLVGTIKEKNESFQSKSSMEIDSVTKNTDSFSFSKTNEHTSRDTHGFFSMTNQNNIRNGDNTYSHSANHTFNSHGREFTGLSNNRDTNVSSSSRSQFGKSSNRRFAPADAEDDDYNALFGSDEERSNDHKIKQDKYNITSAFPPASTWNTNNSDITKRVDWAKMRRTDTTNDMTKWKDFPPVIKEFYVELSDIAEMSTEDVQALCAEKNNIVVTWFDTSLKDDYEQKYNCKLTIPNPIYEFAHAFHNYHEIMNEIAKQGFTEPSPIQCQAWPVALQGHDFIGIAQTGTGKTLAFLLPALIHIDNQPKSKTALQGPKALILSPTRELAIQIHQEVQKYSYRGIRSAVIYGGSSRKSQIFQCEAGVEIIIATPGRLNDLVMSNVIDLRSVTFLVLDEADRMLDMGFEPQIIKILLDIRPDRQTIMTSATWPEDVRRIAARYMRNPIQIYVGTLDLTAVHSVRQEIEIVKEEEKFDLLLDFIGRMDSEDKMIVFVDRKSSADAVASELIRKHISCQSIHGDREQSDREQALEDLKLGTVNILIATDVASRGLDIQDITVVFNYDLPKSMEDYVHRVGRTGRAGKTGYAISLVTRENWGSAGRLIKILEEARQNVPGELRQMAERFQTMQERKREFTGGRNRFGNRDNDGDGRFFGLGSLNSRGNQNGRDREKLPVMNSGWSFSS